MVSLGVEGSPCAETLFRAVEVAHDPSDLQCCQRPSLRCRAETLL